MRLDEAFDAAIRKFYDGFELSETTKINPKMADYSYKSLNSLHEEIVPKKKSKKLPVFPLDEEVEMPESMEMEMEEDI